MSERRHGRVLMMCYFFPPIHSVGANRSVGFASRLGDFGWRPVILTVKKPRVPWERTGAPIPQGLETVRTTELNLYGAAALADGLVHRLFRLFQSQKNPGWVRRTLCLPDPQIAWLSLPTALRLARGVNCVYVSCSPFSAAVTGTIVARRLGKPVVVDFRDPWLASGLAGRMEAWVMAHANAVILNTPSTLAAYQTRFPEAASRMLCIPNGFDRLPEPVPAVPRSGPFTIMHVGEFYGSRSAESLLEVLADLNHPDIEFVQVGPAFPTLSRHEPRIRLRHLDVVPREQALELMQTASLLYLKTFQGSDMARMSVPAKTYEYLATGVPILAECLPGDTADLVREYGTRPELVTPDSKPELAAALLRAYERRHEPAGRVDPRFAERFNRGFLTNQLAATLDHVVAGPFPETPRNRPDTRSQSDVD